MGPTNRTASMSADVADPAAREVTFRRLAEAYTEQARGLLDGGADILLIETVFDTLNAKAALYAIDTLCAERGQRVPVMVSGTLADASGRTPRDRPSKPSPSPCRTRACSPWGSTAPTEPDSCSPYLERLAAVAGVRVSAHPNAGLPNVMGGYDETPAMFAEDVGEYMRRGLVNIVGRLLRHDAGAHFRTVEDRRQLRPAAAARTAARNGAERSGAAADRPRGELHQRRRTHERRRIGLFRPPRARRQLRGGARWPARRSKPGRRSWTSAWTTA